MQDITLDDERAKNIARNMEMLSNMGVTTAKAALDATRPLKAPVQKAPRENAGKENAPRRRSERLKGDDTMEATDNEDEGDEDYEDNDDEEEEKEVRRTLMFDLGLS